MYKQTFSRNQRTKGVRVQSAIKIFIVLAICIWLLYQVKHSHDQKTSFDESNADMLSSTVDQDTRSRTYGRNRKVLPQDGIARNHGDEAIEDEDSHYKPNEREEDVDDRGTGDDRVDENDSLSEEADLEKVQRVEDNEQRHSQEDEGQSILEANSQEARERQYHGDDASSAVVRENNQTLETVDGSEKSVIPVEQQLQVMEKNESTTGGNKGNETLEVDRSGILPGSEHSVPDGTLAADEKQVDNAEQKVLEVDPSKTNTSGTVPQEAGDDIIADVTNTTSSTILMEDRNGTISGSMPQPVEQVEANPATDELSSKSSIKSQDNLSLPIQEEATGMPFENATTPDSTHPQNATTEDIKTNMDGSKDSSSGNALAEQIESFNTTTSANELQENTLSSASSTPTNNITVSSQSANSTQLQSFQDATGTLDSAYGQNSSMLVGTTEGESSVSDVDANSNAKTVESVEGDNLSNTTTAVKPNGDAEEKGAQIHLPTTQDGSGNINATTLDTAAA